MPAYFSLDRRGIKLFHVVPAGPTRPMTCALLGGCFWSELGAGLTVEEVALKRAYLLLEMFHRNWCSRRDFPTGRKLRLNVLKNLLQKWEPITLYVSYWSLLYLKSDLNANLPFSSPCFHRSSFHPLICSNNHMTFIGGLLYQALFKSVLYLLNNLTLITTCKIWIIIISIS